LKAAEERRRSPIADDQHQAHEQQAHQVRGAAMTRKFGSIGFVLVALGAAGLLYPILVGDISPLLWTVSIVLFGAGCIGLVLAVMRRALR
jgi:hypothetical protein